VAQLPERIDDRFGLLADGDRLAEGRHRSLAAAVEWSYQLLDGFERRVCRAVSVFPGPFTLEGAEAVAGPKAGRAVPRLVDCSLLAPPRADPDVRSRYLMLETLRAYGAGLLAEAGEDDVVNAALAGYAVAVAEEAAEGLYTRTWEVAGIRHLDAGDDTLRHALAWAMEQLQIATQTGQRPILLAGLDCCGHLCMATRRPAEAVTLWAATSALAGPWPPIHGSVSLGSRDELLKKAGQLLGPTKTRMAEERGAAMSLATAAEYALLLAAAPPLAANGSAGGRPAAGGPAAHSAADGVAAGGPAVDSATLDRAVSSHLDRIRDKTGCRRRADLTRLALSAGLV
jgi:hypothetical protein